MTTEPYGVTIFCDDIRYELNGKLTLVGSYLSEMNFSGSAPGLLPTFAALVNIRIPLSFRFSKLKLRVVREIGSDIETIFEGVLDSKSELHAEGTHTSADDQLDEKVNVVTFPIQWSPMSFSGPGFVKVRCYLDDTYEIKLGALQVGFTPEEEANNQPSDRAD